MLTFTRHLEFLMKLVKAISVLFVLLFIYACANNQGEIHSSYDPISINDASTERSATIEVAGDLFIWMVDNNREIDFINAFFGFGLDSIRVKGGLHSLYGHLDGQDVLIPTTYYHSGHEYLIDYAIKDNKTHYWVKDLKTNKVVYGREIL